jgi:hypothetical protein
MRYVKGVALGVVAWAVVVAASAPAAGSATSTYVYNVPGSSVPGVSTGLVVDPASTVVVTATGAICPYGGSFCPGPNGDTGWNTTGTGYGGFPLPGGPAWGLVARVGAGSWVHVGVGPTTVSGTGELEFAVNDDYLPDNTGSFTVTVTVTTATAQETTCKPGWGYGDENHDHCGPPGLADKPERGEQGTSGQRNGNARGRPNR